MPLEKFETPELDCTKMRECSWQRDRQTKKLVGTEDCLHLNIYGPVKPTIQILPVMVWIHGGGFSYGHGQEYDISNNLSWKINSVSLLDFCRSA